MSEKWGLVELPVFPFHSTATECEPALTHGFEFIIATGKCASCGGRMIPAEEMENGWSMHRKSCVFIALGTHRTNILLKEMGF